MKIKINDNRYLGTGERPFIIAEIGNNHNGDIEIAKKLIEEAKRCGVDAVKFQTKNVEESFSKELLDKEYTGPNSFGKTYREHKEYLEFSDEELVELASISKEQGILFSCSAFDIDSYDFIEKSIDPEFHKIPSPLTVNHELLLHVAHYNKPIFISTGMTNEKEVDVMVNMIKKVNPKIVLMQCTSLYPTENYETNLNVIKTFQEKYNILTGFSSHDRSVVFPAVAVALGARVIEKHVTQDRALAGPDHASSFEPRGLELACKYIKDTFEGLGESKKTILPREIVVRQKHFQSIVASRNIKKGDKLIRSMLTFKSPGDGLLPSQISEILGKILIKDLDKDMTITIDDLD